VDGGQAEVQSLNDAEIERMVSSLRRIERESAWERMLEVGRLVFQGIVGSNEAAWRSRRGSKEVSLRKLAEHQGCPHKKSTLCSAVNVLLFVVRYPTVRQMTGITPTHVVQVLGLEAEEAYGLLDRASQGAWSARDLARDARSLRKSRGERRGRPLATRYQRAETIGRRVERDLRSLQAMASAGEWADAASNERLQLLLEGISNLALAAMAQATVTSRASAFLPIAKVEETAVDCPLTARAS
jgi:hypothetical protein